MKIAPAGHKILVRPKPVEKTTQSGIVVMLDKDEDRYQEATTEGTVVALGPTAYKSVDDGQPWVKPGDYISYGKYAGAVILDEETKEKYVVIHDVDVVAILTQE